MDLLLEHTGKGFLTMLSIAMPAVLTAAGIGLVVGILQAITQVQEQTIAAAPKILGVFIVIMAMGPFSANILQEYFVTAANIAFDIMPRSEEKVLTDHDFRLYKQKQAESDYYNEKTADVDELMKKQGKTPYSKPKDKETTETVPTGSSLKPNLLEQQHIQSGE